MFVGAEEERQAIMEQFQKSAQGSDATSISALLRVIEASSEDIEQELETGKVNILTMHKAKGLTARAVIVGAAEDEYLPGRAEGEGVGDERRLLYVSLTRAKHFLFITYCDKRIRQQRHTGRTSGSERRSLTQFLRDGPIAPRSGEDYLRNLSNQQS
jgi:superfamily I DNA/RNA helicase